ncbi:MAG: hypothetical protein Phog2KO_20870 [Phototrophicaceae bacterium]
MLARHKVGALNAKERRLYVKDNEHFGSLDAGFFWFSGRQFGCLIAAILLFMPAIMLAYGLYVIFVNNPDYELSFFPLETLRIYTTTAILLFTPLLPFRLWLLISAIISEQSIDREIAQDEYKNGDKPKNSPPWRKLSPENALLKNYGYKYQNGKDKENLRLLKLAHILIEKKNHPNVLNYGDIQDIENNLINQNWHGALEENVQQDHYLVMAALYKEHGAMSRLTRSLSRLKYHQPQKNLRLLLLLEESEHGAEKKNLRDGSHRYQTRGELIIKDYEKNLKTPGKKSADNRAQFLIDGISFILMALTRLVAYIVTPIVTYKWFNKNATKQLFGDPSYYSPNNPSKDTFQKPKVKKPVTTYQAAILNLLQSPNQTIDLDNKKYQDIRRSFAIAFVPNIGQLGETHRQEAQTKPRALNYGIYQHFKLDANATTDDNDAGNPSVTRNRAIRLQPFVLSCKEDYKNLQELKKLFECLSYLTTCYHEVLPNKPYSKGEDVSEKWKHKFRDGYHNSENYNTFVKGVMRVVTEQLKLLQEETQFKNFPEKLSLFGYQLNEELNVQIFSDNFYKKRQYADIKNIIYETIKVYIQSHAKKFKSNIAENSEKFDSFLTEFKRSLRKSILFKLLKYDATYTKFEKVLCDILKCKVTIKAIDDSGGLAPIVDKGTAYYEHGKQEPYIFVEDNSSENNNTEKKMAETGYLGGYLLRMLTGYHDRYYDTTGISEDDLALLCMSEDVVQMWGVVDDILDKHIEYIEKLGKDGLLDKDKKSDEDMGSKSVLQAMLLPAFFDMDYRYQNPASGEAQQCQSNPQVVLSEEDKKQEEEKCKIFYDQWSPKYCAIYDAEDRPEEDQLLKSVYTYKFYEMLPILLWQVLGESFMVRAKYMLIINNGVSRKKIINPNVKIRFMRQKKSLLSNVRTFALIRKTHICRRARTLANMAKHNQKELKRLRDYDQEEKLSAEYNTWFNKFIEEARQFHYKLLQIEEENKNYFSKKYEQLYISQPITEHQEKRNREYFWWRAGLHLYDFLEKRRKDAWGKYLEKAYPERTRYSSGKEARRNYQHQIVCLQAKLTYENLNDNWLISLFKADYATWFNYILPGLHVHNLPIPLGGTSNHFDMSFLTEIGGWDSFNVAEDCDLGMWIARHGKHVSIVESITWEVANHDTDAWIKQHSRWNKGYMQSYFVHMRQPFALLRDLGWKGFLSFQLTVGAGFLLPMLSISFYAMTFIYITSLLAIVTATRWAGTISTPLFFINDIHYYWILPFGTGSLFISNAIFFLILLIGHLRHPKPGSMRFVVQWWWLYWLITVIASFRALYEYLFNPFHWVKSDHNYL